jgi:hypothetical protein
MKAVTKPTVLEAVDKGLSLQLKSSSEVFVDIIDS